MNREWRNNLICDLIDAWWTSFLIFVFRLVVSSEVCVQFVGCILIYEQARKIPEMLLEISYEYTKVEQEYQQWIFFIWVSKSNHISSYWRIFFVIRSKTKFFHRFNAGKLYTNIITGIWIKITQTRGFPSGLYCGERPFTSCHV